MSYTPKIMKEDAEITSPSLAVSLILTNNAINQQEAERQLSEEERILAESDRESSEVIRNASESTRISNENTRVSDEATRQNFYNAYKVLVSYNSSTAYIVGNKVTYQGGTYQCILNTTGNSPIYNTDNTWWKCIASSGVGGDMLKSIYDPNNTNADAFNSENHAYDNTISGLTAENTKDAIDELTASNTDLVVAVNEVNANVGNKSSLLTTIKTSIVAAINELVGSITKLVTRLLDMHINVKDYGATGDGITDDTVSIQNAIADGITKKCSVFFPTGNYIVSDTININNGVKICGVDTTISESSVIKQTVNKPLFYVTNQCTFEKLTLIGSNNATYTLQDGIYINNTNGVAVREVNFFLFYNDVHIKDTVFYSYFDNCIWYSCVHAMIYGEGTSSAGYAFEINDCQVIASAGQYGFRFRNAGSVMIDNLMMSPQNLSVTGLCFESLATQAGISQISNSGFEPSTNHAVELIGTSINPIKFIFFTNCYMGADLHTLYMEYANNIHLTNCYLTGSILVYTKYSMDAIHLNSCEFQSTSAPITCDSVNCTQFAIDVVDPNYGGATFFIYVPFLTANKVKRISVVGGTIGTNSNPISVVDGAKNVHIDVIGYNLNPYHFKRMVGTLDASGNITVSHGVYGLNSLILHEEGFFHNGSYLAQKLNLVSVTPTDISYSGGTANAKYRITVMYTENDDSNWV